MQPNKHVISKVWDECPRCGNIIPSGASEARHVLRLEIKSNLTVLDLNTSVNS